MCARETGKDLHRGFFCSRESLSPSGAVLACLQRVPVPSRHLGERRGWRNQEDEKETCLFRKCRPTGWLAKESVARGVKLKYLKCRL